MTRLEGQRVILGVTGSIAAFKAAALASQLTQMGVQVRTVMTPASERFVSRQTFTSVTGIPALSSLWEEQNEPSSGHVHLASEADLIVVAPASADFIARMALGLADDLLGAILLAFTGPLMVAPAMETNMYLHPATQANLEALRVRGVATVGPVKGHLASGAAGSGRMSEPSDIIAAVEQVLRKRTCSALRDIPILVTAGPTQEPIDPVRYVSNRSSGKMGYELARAAEHRGARVTLISGPVEKTIRQSLPESVRVVDIQTAEQMRDAVLEAAVDARALIMAAAVADFRPSVTQAQKIKKGDQPTSLRLEPTDDILSLLKIQSPNILRIGFAAETADLESNAKTKLERKGLAMIVANRIATSGPTVFGADVNQVTMLRRDGLRVELPVLSKSAVADAVLDQIEDLLTPSETAE